MKLYLSSYRIPTPEDFFELLPKPPEETRLAIITNAKDYRPEREKKLHELSNDLGKLGLTNMTYIDLRDYSHPDDLFEELNYYDGLYLCGGNTFDLNYAIWHRRLDKAILKHAHQDMPILGESAGAIVMGKTLVGFESPEDLPHVQSVITKGLFLVNGVVVPHADNPTYNDRAPALQEMYGKNIIVLNDNQAYIVNNDEGRIVTGDIC